jgi:hypothetical protein
MTMQLENILQNEVLVNSSPNVQNYRIWQQSSPQNGMMYIHLSADINNIRYAAVSVVDPVTIEMDHLAVVVQTLNQEILQFSNRTNPHRRLRAMWTVEAQQDLRAWHNLESEFRLAQTLSVELMSTINKETSRCDWKKEGF